MTTTYNRSIGLTTACRDLRVLLCALNVNDETVFIQRNKILDFYIIVWYT